jgi:hypothetical protein
MLSRVAGYYQGSLPIRDLMGMTFREMKRWYDLRGRELVEDSIIAERARKNEPPLTDRQLRRETDRRLAKYRGE